MCSVQGSSLEMDDARRPVPAPLFAKHSSAHTPLTRSHTFAQAQTRTRTQARARIDRTGACLRIRCWHACAAWRCDHRVGSGARRLTRGMRRRRKSGLGPAGATSLAAFLTRLASLTTLNARSSPNKFKLYHIILYCIVLYIYQISSNQSLRASVPPQSLYPT